MIRQFFVKRTLAMALVVTSVAVGVGLCGQTQSACAQMRMGGMGGMGGGGVEQVDQSALDEYGAIVGLDDTQKLATKALLEGYASGFEQARKARDEGFKKIREEFADTQDAMIWQRELPKIMEDYGNKTKELDAQLLGDIKSLLTDTQATKWIQVERAHRRRQSVPRGMLSGESVDLVRVVNELKMPAVPDTVSQALERYAGEIDGALAARDRKQDEMAKDFQPGGKRSPAAGQGIMNMDFEGIQKALAEVRKAGIPIRDINDRFASVIEGALQGDKQTEFADKYRKAKFPQVYGTAYPIRALDAADKFSDLTPEQKSTLASIRESYQRDITSANTKWASEIAKAEADGGGDDMMGGWMRMMQGGGDNEPESELVKARKARRQMDRDATDKIKAALNEAQKDRLPERDDPMGGGMRMRMGR